MSDENSTEGRAYFERGCLCLISGAIDIRPHESNAKAFSRYMTECACSRHPDAPKNLSNTPD